MPIRINRARLKSERHDRGWSQDHLAEASGVSVRTVQRLEKGEGAAYATVMAVAAAMTLPMSALVTPAGPARRVTPLTILPDIGPALARYRDLGFLPVETGDPGCMGLRAGNSHIILCTRAFMTSGFQTGSIEPLVGRTIPYVWVESVDAAAGAYARVIEKVVTSAGTREALVEDEGQWAILAEVMP